MVDFTKLNKLSKDQITETKKEIDVNSPKKLESYNPLQYKAD